MIIRILLVWVFTSVIVYISSTGLYATNIDDGTLRHRINNLSIFVNDTTVLINWDPSSIAGSYKVYSCSNPTGPFTENLGGVFDGSSWVCQRNTGEPMKFYFVTALLRVLTIEAVDEYGTQLPAWIFLNGSFIGITPLILEGYSSGTYSVWCPPLYPDGSYIWDPSEIVINDNLIDRNIVFHGFYWM